MQDIKTKYGAIANGMQTMKQSLKQMREQIERHNEQAFTLISNKLTEVYKQFVPTKTAKLCKIGERIEDGVDLIVTDNASKVDTALMQLSGGQKTLLAMALVFAMAHISKSPMYITDEIDAALDEQNQALVAQVMKQTFSSCQMICVSHHNNFQQEASTTIHLEKQGQYSRVQSSSQDQ